VLHWQSRVLTPPPCAWRRWYRCCFDHCAILLPPPLLLLLLSFLLVFAAAAAARYQSKQQQNVFSAVQESKTAAGSLALFVGANHAMQAMEGSSQARTQAADRRQLSMCVRVCETA
jgi:hypothetical protein